MWWPITHTSVNTLRPRQNGRHFAGDILKCIFLNENTWISIKISLKFVPRGPINKLPALVRIMAWRRSGDKPLSEPMVVSLLTHICVTRPQWVKNSNTPCNLGNTHISNPTLIMADSRLASSQWDASLQSNAVSNSQGTILKSALHMHSI